MKKHLPPPSHPVFGSIALAALLVSAVASADGAEAGVSSAAVPPPKVPDRQRIDSARAKEWSEIKKVMPEVSYDGIPLFEVTKQLRDEFKNEFDVLLPSAGFQTMPAIDPATGLPTGAETADAGAINVRLRLSKVTICEVFNAMNIMFELDRIPVHWDLMTNGSRPTAVLRILETRPPTVPAPLESPKRAVFYLGDLLGGSSDTRAEGFRQIQKTLLEVCEEALRRHPRISVHEAAQLLVVVGTADEVDLIRETLMAMKENVRVASEPKAQPKARESGGNLAEPKTRW